MLNIQYRFNKPSFVFFVKVLKGIWRPISLQKSSFTSKFWSDFWITFVGFCCSRFQRRISTYQSIKTFFQSMECFVLGDCSGNQQLPLNTGKAKFSKCQRCHFESNDGWIHGFDTAAGHRDLALLHVPVKKAVSICENFSQIQSFKGKEASPNIFCVWPTSLY